MTITVEGSQELTYQSGSPVTSRTINVATGTRTNGYIAVAVDVISYSGGGDVTGITWNGTAMTQAIETSDTAPFADWWYILDPEGGTHDIVISFSASGINEAHMVVVWGNSTTSLTFGDTNTYAAGTEDPTSISLTATATGELCFSTYVTADNAVAVSDDTLLQDWDSGGNCTGSSYLVAGAPGSVSLGWDRNATGLSAPFNLAAFSVYEAASGSSPTIVQNTPDLASFADSTPTLEFTATDADGDDVRYNIQITDNPDDFAGGVELEDSYDPGTYLGIIHPNPDPVATTWQGDIQVDDRPGQSFTGNGGILYSAHFRFGVDVDTAGYYKCRVYAHQGVFGTSSEPLNPADPADTPTPDWLAESDAYYYDTGGSSGFHEMLFTGDNRIRLEVGTHYVVIIDWIPDTNSYDNTITVKGHTDLGHAGNAYIDGNSVPNNGIYAGADVLFKIYEEYILLDKVSGTDAGFSNLNSPGDTDPFNSGDAAAFTVQPADYLADGTYYWRVRAKDPAGTDIYSSWSSTRSFTIDGGSPPGGLAEGVWLIIGGAIQPVSIIANPDRIESHVAIPAYGVTVVDRPVIGGPAIPVYIVSQEQVDAGEYKILGGEATPMADITVVGIARSIENSPAIPIFIAGGSLT